MPSSPDASGQMIPGYTHRCPERSRSGPGYTGPENRDIERVNSRLKEHLGLDHITLRGQAKVTVRAVLSLVVMLGVAVGMAERHRACPERSEGLKELRRLVA